MGTEEIQEAIEEISESIIKEYRFDILHSTIYLSGVVRERGLERQYNITISNVSMCCYLNDTTDDRKKMMFLDGDEYLELTAINVASGKTKLIFQVDDDDEWLAQYGANVNLVIEVWSKVIMVEAKSIKINDIEFTLY